MLAPILKSLSSPEYVLSLPIILLVLFAAGLWLMDFVTPAEWKWMNGAAAFVGIVFSAAGVVKIQLFQNDLETSGGRLEWAFRHSVLLDHLSIFFYYLFLLSAAISVLILSSGPKCSQIKPAKLYAYILLNTAGMMCAASAFDLVFIFVGIEVMGVSAYLLVTNLYTDVSRRESGFKFFFRGGFASLIFVCGLGLLYGLTGSTNLQFIAQALKNNFANRTDIGNHVGIILAVILIVTGLCAQIAAMPFHRWMVNLCESSSLPMAGFVVVTFQATGWAILLRILLWGMYSLRADYIPMLMFVSVISMIGASFVTLTQARLPRLLAYSSIAHTGFMILGIISLASVVYPDPAFFEGFKGVLIYLAVYTCTTIGVFALVGLLSRGEVAMNSSTDGMEKLSGLFYRSPMAAIFVLSFLCSLAGIPFLAGFFGKYFILHSLFRSGHYDLAVLALVSWLIGLYYYGRLAQLLFARDNNKIPISIGIPAAVSLGAIALLALMIGIYPKPLLLAIEWSLRLI